ncbi:hypothetical protein AX17_002177 [Amanita inopinata Kibby_2008]|nr:hypothetical protein AX17_002177 [Amanita inopinata Kibby_2008]
MLLTPTERMRRGGYDVPEGVLRGLEGSRVRHVSILVRRGVGEVKFTAKEVREMMNLEGVAMVPIPEQVFALATATGAGEKEGRVMTRQQSRILQLLQKGSKNPYGSTQKTFSIDFYRSPIKLDFNPSPPSSSGHPLRLTLAHTQPQPQPHTQSQSQSHLDTSLIITSLGFRSSPDIPFYDPELGRIRTTQTGRVVVAPTANPGSPVKTVETLKTLKNVYASGWAAGGAKGVLASTMVDAYNVAATIVSDYHSGREVGEVGGVGGVGGVEVMNARADMESLPEEVKAGLNEGRVVTFEDWKKVDKEEVRRGRALGKERERMDWEGVGAFLGLARGS